MQPPSAFAVSIRNALEEETSFSVTTFVLGVLLCECVCTNVLWAMVRYAFIYICQQSVFVPGTEAVGHGCDAVSFLVLNDLFEFLFFRERNSPHFTYKNR